MTMFARKPLTGLALVAFVLAGVAPAGPAHAQYAEKIANDPAVCDGAGPAVRIVVAGIKSGKGNMRVQIYRATKADWLAKNRWVYRIEAPARAGSMTFCMPLPAAGSYAVALRHDANNNNETDIFADGGAMSNNPSVNLFNLGRPSISKAAFDVGNEVKTINLKMRYL